MGELPLRPMGGAYTPGMHFARAASVAILASLLLAGMVLATIGSTWVGVQIVVVGGLFFGLVVPLGDDDGDAAARGSE